MLDCAALLMAHCSGFFYQTHSHWWVWQLLLVASLFWSIPLLGNRCSFFNLVQLCWLHFITRCILCAAASQNNMLMVGCQKKMQWGFLFCKLIVSKKIACWCSDTPDTNLLVEDCLLCYVMYVMVSRQLLFDTNQFSCPRDPSSHPWASQLL